MNIGKPKREITVEPFPEADPIIEPVPEPIRVPEPKKKVPVHT